MNAAAAPAALVPASDGALLVRFGDAIDLDAHGMVLRLTSALRRQALPFIRNLHPAYSSLLISFDPRAASLAVVQELVVSLLPTLPSVDVPAPRRIEIPVCYAPAFAPDLDAVAAHHGMSTEDVVALHTEAEYLVYFLGFSPGFPYMGGLSPRLATPRLATPRPHVPPGSVGIGGIQTGIYPVASPGGWRLIGRTPLRLFLPEAAMPTLLQMGDVVRFKRIYFDEYESIARRVGAHQHEVQRP